MEDLVVIGAGGHGRVLIDALALEGRYRVVGAIGTADEVGTSVLGVPVIGTEADLTRVRVDGAVAAAIGIGSLGDVSARVAASRAVREAGLQLPPIVHPSAVLSPSAVLGEGAFVAAGAVVGPQARIGACSIVNTGAVVDHDCVIGDFAHVSPGAALSGGVVVGDRTHIGTGCAIIQYVTVGADTLVGAGAVVVDDIEGGVVAVGNPARVVRSRT